MEKLKQKIDKILAELEGQAGVVVKTKREMININGDLQMQAASVIKVPILMEAFRQAENRQLELSDSVRILEDDRVGGAGVLKALSTPLSLSMQDLLKLMIIVSDNTAANKVIDQLGMEDVNHLCKELACNKTTLSRYFMDIEAQQSGKENTTTAKDMVKLCVELDQGKLFNQDAQNSMLEILSHQQLNSKLPLYNDDKGVFIANKTGELPGVEHDVGIFKYGSQTVYVAVLLSNLNHNAQGKTAISRIGRAIIDFILMISK